MIGDSITEGFDTVRHLSDFNILNLGVSGDSTVELLERISDGWFRDMPAAAFLCIGTNDLARGRDEYYILNNIINIINRIKSFSPEIKIVIVSVFPTRNNEPRPNNIIIRVNNLLKSFAGQGGTDFLNIYDSFLDSEKKLKSEFTQDGLHLTEPAYSEWAVHISEYIKTKLT